MQNYSPKFSGILLAGGKSSRMGEDKAFISYGGQYLYDYSLSILKFFTTDILVSSSNPRFDQTNYRRIEDEITGIGPLGGIYTCLKYIKNQSAIILPCDLPLITRKIVDILLVNSNGYELTIALNPQNLPEPLIGIYSSALIPVIDKMIDSNYFKMQELFSYVKTNFVKIHEAPPETFRNINSPEDFNLLPHIENPLL